MSNPSFLVPVINDPHSLLSSLLFHAVSSSHPGVLVYFPLCMCASAHISLRGLVGSTVQLITALVRLVNEHRVHVGWFTYDEFASVQFPLL